MITKNIIKQPKSIVEVQVSVPWTDLQPVWDSVLAKMGQETEVAGFRKGTAPANMVEQTLGNKLQEEFLKTVMPQFLVESLKETDVVPIDYPNYQLIAFSKGGELQYKATVTNKPVITVGNYKTIKAVKPVAKLVSETEVTKVLEDLLKRYQARQGSNITGAPQIPVAMDDKFAIAMGAKDMAELKSQVRKDLDAQVKYNTELDFEEAILQEVEKITQVDIPEVLVNDELNRMLVSLQRRVADMGLLMEDYLKGQGKTVEQIKTEWRPQAEKNVRMELGLAEVAKAENVNITDEEVQAEIDKITDQKIKQQFDFPEPRMQLRHSLRQVRTLDLLKKIVSPF